MILIVVLLAGAVLVSLKKTGRQSSTTNNIKATVNKDTGGLINYSDEGMTLTVNQPLDKAVVNQPNLTVSGKTKPLVDVFINDTQLKADTQGNFSGSLSLEEGENTIVIVVNDDSGNFAEKELTVTLETVQ